MKRIALQPTLFLCLLLTGCLYLHAEPSNLPLNTIGREIWREGGSVFIKDNLHYTQGFSLAQSGLGDIFYEVKQGGINGAEVRKYVNNLLTDEDLEVMNISGTYTNGFVDLHILSRVAMELTNTVAKLHLVSSLGEAAVIRKRTFPFMSQTNTIEYLGGRIKNELIIAKVGERYYLMFPDFGSAKRDLKNFDEFKRYFNFKSFYDSERFGFTAFYTCTLNNSERVSLLNWSIDNVSSEPTLSQLRQMNDVAKMSENDLLNICTTMKVAKGGWYELIDEKHE